MGKTVSDLFVEIDLRSPAISGSYNDQGKDRARQLISTMDQLPDTGILKLTASQRPDELIGLLQNRGYRVNVRQWPDHTWDVEALAANAPDIVDLRELEAPEPMEKILLACSRFTGGEIYLARLPHVPLPLFPHLESRGLSWKTREEPDQSALLMVWRDT